jgi:TetR/AcrR family transcriptional repressor of mexJK operon
MSGEATSRRGRPRGSGGAELLDIARAEFLRHGYARTTMDAVAAAARISKNSLYREFPSKGLLYAVVVTDWVDRGRDAMRPHTEVLAAAQDTEAALRDFARVLQAAILSPPVLQMRTLVAAEAPLFPEVARDYVTRSWDRNLDTLADAFRRLAERGAIVTDAPHTAAEQFTWLAIAAPLNRLTLQADAEHVRPAELDRIADEAVATFLARFGPRS